MFLFLAFLIFTGALGATAYYVWSVPQQEAQELLANRLRELRLAGGGRSRTAGDLVRSEHAGRFALGGGDDDFGHDAAPAKNPVRRLSRQWQRA